MEPGDYLGGTKKITTLQLAFRRRDRNFTLLPNLVPRVLSYPPGGRVGENPGNEVGFYHSLIGQVHDDDI